MESKIEKVERRLKKAAPSDNPYRGYSDQNIPLSGYLALTGVYVGALALSGFIISRRKRRPADVRIKDLALIGVATHKVSRILTQERATSSLRAPFTELEEASGSGEVSEKSRGQGLRRAVGDLLVCPWCANPWIATGFMFGLACWPAATRHVAGIFSSVAVADFLNHGYVKVKELND